LETKSVQRIKRRLGSLEVRRIEYFAEPVVDGRKKIASFSTFTLGRPEAREAGRSAQLKESYFLPHAHQQIASHPKNSRFVTPLFHHLDYPRAFCKTSAGLIWRPSLA
jgi:hypothetical protein